MSDRKKETVYKDDGSWWWDNEGVIQGPFATRELARACRREAKLKALLEPKAA